MPPLILFIAEDKNIKASPPQKLNALKSLKKKILNLKKLLAEKELQIQILTYSFPSFEYRKIIAILKQMGYHVNHKRIYRIYKQLNLQKSTSKGYKKKLLRHLFKPLNPSKTNELWSLDVIEDTLQKNGFVKKIRILNLIDVFSKFAFPPLVNLSLAEDKVAKYLEGVIERYGYPEAIIRDDGVEFRSKNFQRVMRKYRIKEIVIPPGKTFKNGYVESFHSRMREELLDAELFESPYSALGGRTSFEVFKKGGNLT